jgi:hypothetical protein
MEEGDAGEWVLKQLQMRVDGVVKSIDAEEFECNIAMAMKSNVMLGIQGLLQDESCSTTSQGSANRKYHWASYVVHFHSEEILAGETQLEVYWPPSEEDWVEYLVEMREKTSSRVAFEQRVECVCSVGRNLDANGSDPSKLYKRSHQKTMQALLRHYGQCKGLVEHINMWEARNGPLYVDHASLRGCQMAASWCLGCTTGRRPRTLVEVRLRNVTLTVEAVTWEGQRMLVPAMRIEYLDEKFMDVGGPRATNEHYYGKDSDYGTIYLNGAAYWVYRMLAMRGAFECMDPLLAAKEGQVLKFREEALDWMGCRAC